MHGDSLGSDGSDLHLVVGFLVSEEHDHQAVVQKFASFLLSHVIPLVILQKDLAVVGTQSSDHIVVKDLCSVQISDSEEWLLGSLVEASDHS